MAALLMVILAYLLGSIPTAIIAGRLRQGIDIRAEGSGNAGATNAARILGFKAGIAVAVVDLAKGFLAVLLVSRIAPLAGGGGPALCGIAAVTGHIFPVFAGFRGGKGVATAAGAAIALFPILAPFCLAIFLLVAALGRWIVLASLTAAFVLPGMYLTSSLFGTHFDPWKAGFGIAVFLIIIFTHRNNIARLIRGKEERLDINRMFHAAKKTSVVIIGAGATGRGHVAQLAFESGYRLVFLDKNEGLCATLREAGSYSVRLVSAHTRTVTIDGFTIFATSQKDEFYPFFRDAPLLFTAVCPGNIRDAADYMRDLIIRWLEECGTEDYKNILCCENMNNSSTTFREFLLVGFPPRLREKLERQFGFADTMVARVVTTPSDPLQLLGEEYSGWTADRTALRGPNRPSIRTLDLVDDQTSYLQRKLYIHNTGHATFGYLGFLKGYTWIHEAAQDPEIMAVCEKTIEESGWAIEKEYGISAEDMRTYRAALTEKCVNPALPDKIVRVVREPIRKLGGTERFFGPIGLMLKHGRQPEFLLYGVCAALLSRIPGDAQSERLAERMREKGLSCLEEITGVPVPAAVRSRVESLLPVVRARFGKNP